MRRIGVVCLTMETVYVSEETQRVRLQEETVQCMHRMVNDEDPYNGTSCDVAWDGLSCWGYTAAGTVATQNCPNYVNKFNPSALARRTCLPEGEWFVNPQYNKSWTNYTECMIPTEKKENISEYMMINMGRIKMMYNIGYGISLISLVTAVVVMLSLRRLRCARNTIHIHLFLSFIFRSLMAILKDNLLVEGLGFPSDVTYTSDGDLLFLSHGTHWECKLFFTLINYSLAANYGWILVEGLYLYMLLYVTVFSENNSIVAFAVTGWCTPLVSIIPWVITRALLEDKLCWNVHQNVGYFWILKGPIVLSIVINFYFFVNIVRILFSKLVAINAPEARQVRYRKLAKSTLVLIPLFGVHYILFIGLPDNVDETAEIVKLYYEMFFNSFQGFFVAMLFCFLNGEVRSEVKKKWQRRRLQQIGLFSMTTNTGSMKMSTASTFTGRNRSMNSYSSESKKDHAQHNGHAQTLLNNKVSCVTNDVTTPIIIMQDHVNETANEETNLMMNEEATDIFNVSAYSEPNPYGQTTECISPAHAPTNRR